MKGVKNVGWMTENGIPAPALGTGDARFYFGKRGSQELFGFVVGPPARLGRSGVADVFKGDGLVLGRCVPPRAAFKAVIVAVSGAAVIVVSRGTEMEEVAHCKTKKKKLAFKRNSSDGSVILCNLSCQFTSLPLHNVLPFLSRLSFVFPLSCFLFCLAELSQVSFPTVCDY